MNARSKSMTAYLCGGIVIAGALPLLLSWAAFNEPMPSGSPRVLNIGMFEQWLVVITAFVVKPAYMFLSLVWIIWLWQRQASDLVALRWGLICFLSGEVACATNYVAFSGCSPVVDYLHSYGMAVGFSFIAYAVLEGIDLRVVKYSAPKDRCAALSLCRACIKYADVPCALRRIFGFLIPALVIVSLMLPCVELNPVSQRINILNSAEDFMSPNWAQLFEGWYCAMFSVFLLLGSWGALTFKRDDPVATAKIFFAAAMGPLGFGLLRVFLRTAYRDNLAWANIWEELTELIFVVAVGIVLWLFRGALFRQEPLPSSEKSVAAIAEA